MLNPRVTLGFRVHCHLHPGRVWLLDALHVELITILKSPPLSPANLQSQRSPPNPKSHIPCTQPTSASSCLQNRIPSSPDVVAAPILSKQMQCDERLEIVASLRTNHFSTSRCRNAYEVGVARAARGVDDEVPHLASSSSPSQNAAELSSQICGSVRKDPPPHEL